MYLDAIPWAAYAYMASTIGALFAMAAVREVVYALAERWFGIHYRRW